MTTFNTGNPIGSTDARDRLDNSENMDILENSTTLNAHADRLGTMRKTRKGMELEHDNQISAHEAEHDSQIAAHELEHDNQMQYFENDFDSRLAGMAFTRVGTFAAGYTLTDARQVLLYETDGHECGWTGAFPKVVPPASTPAGTGGVGAGAWVDRTDLTLRDEIRETVFQNMKRSYAEAGFNLVDGSFQGGAVLSGWPDVLWDWSTGVAYQWHLNEAKTVPAGSTPATTGGIGAGAWVDRTDNTLRNRISGLQFIKSAQDLPSSILIAGDRIWIDDRQAYFNVKSGVPNGFDKVDAGNGLIAELSLSRNVDAVNFGADPSGVKECADNIIRAISYANNNNVILTCDGVFKTNKSIRVSSSDRNRKLRLNGAMTIFPSSDTVGVAIGSYVEWQTIRVLADNIVSNVAISSVDMYRCKGGSLIIDVLGGAESACVGWAGTNIFLNSIDYVYIARVRRPTQIPLEFNANTIGNMEWHACKSEKGILGNIKSGFIGVFTIEDCGSNGGWITGSNFAAEIGTLYLEANPNEVVIVESSLAHGFPDNNGAGLKIGSIFTQDTGKTSPSVRIKRHLDVNIGSATISGTSGDWLVVEGNPEITGNLGYFSSGYNNPTMRIDRKSFFRSDKISPSEQLVPDNRLGRSNPHVMSGNGQTVREITYDSQSELISIRIVGEKLSDGTAHNGYLIATVDTVGNAGVMVISSVNASAGTNQGWSVTLDKELRTVAIKNKTSMSQGQSANVFITSTYKKYNPQA